jgi:predicted RNase H-like HicB family nuclease
LGQRSIEVGEVHIVQNYTAIIKEDGDWWIGWIEEMPGAIAQEHTLDEARQSLRDVIPVLLEVQREQQAAVDIREDMSVNV